MFRARDIRVKGDYTCMGSGLVTLDVIFRADSGEPEFMAGGSCGNVLTILSYLGWKSLPVVRLGCDIEGDRVVEDMGTWGVQDRFIERDPRTDSPKIMQRTYVGKNPRHTFSLRCAHGKRLPYARPFRLSSLRQIEDGIPTAHVFYFDRATPSSVEIARRQKRLGALIVFEPPRLRDEKNFRACVEISDILKHCGDAEPEDYGCIRPPLEIQTRGRKGLRYRTASMLPHTDWPWTRPLPWPWLGPRRSGRGGPLFLRAVLATCSTPSGRGPEASPAPAPARRQRRRVLRWPQGRGLCYSFVIRLLLVV